MAERGPRARIERFVDWVGRCTSWLALVIVALMSVNVVLRYLFSIGSVWSQELEWHLLVPLILFGCAYAMRHGEHVRVDIIYGGFSEKNKGLVDLLSALLMVAIAALFIWYSLHYVQQAYVIDEGSPDPGGIPHRYLLKGLLPVGFALLLVQALASALASAEKLRSPR
ncbi:MAG: C4-dicarboxylate ABC transporter permease [Betaproteobacteria bacterium RIFCSPLOWO2_12_FULL_65_14]|nr:MAG: C4-dicarboxylate ABC transporter permease [Betaproteobacteria bacterium RIFCSPLOWO2_12_FULL_65_14]